MNTILLQSDSRSLFRCLYEVWMKYPIYNRLLHECLSGGGIVTYRPGVVEDINGCASQLARIGILEDIGE